MPTGERGQLLQIDERRVASVGAGPRLAQEEDDEAVRESLSGEALLAMVRETLESPFDFDFRPDTCVRGAGRGTQQSRERFDVRIWPVRSARREFNVSADGIRDRFPPVRRLVAAAPRLANWIVIPFRPPKDIELAIQYGESRLGPDDVWFTSEPDGGRVGLTLFVNGLTEDNYRALAGAGFVLLDSALGEYVVEMQVGFIEWKTLPDDPATARLTPFHRVREVFDTKAH